MLYPNQNFCSFTSTKPQARSFKGFIWRDKFSPHRAHNYPHPALLQGCSDTSAVKDFVLLPWVVWAAPLAVFTADTSRHIFEIIEEILLSFRFFFGQIQVKASQVYNSRPQKYTWFLIPPLLTHSYPLKLQITPLTARIKSVCSNKTLIFCFEPFF